MKTFDLTDGDNAWRSEYCKHLIIGALACMVWLSLSGCGQKPEPPAGHKDTPRQGANIQAGTERPEQVVDKANIAGLVKLLEQECAPGAKRTSSKPVESPRLAQIRSALIAAPAGDVEPLLCVMIEKASLPAAGEAATILAARHDISALKPIWQRYTRGPSSPALRAQLRTAVGELPRSTTAAFLASQLKDQDYRLRLSACELLAWAPDEGSIR